MINGILDDHIQFKGKDIISPRDLQSLDGGSAEAEEDNCLTNFLIDAYLKLVKAMRNISGVTVFPWEIFEKFFTKILIGTC